MSENTVDPAIFKGMYAYLCGKCNGVYYYSKRLYGIGDMPLVSEILFANGQQPLAGSRGVCGSCGQPAEHRFCYLVE